MVSEMMAQELEFRKRMELVLESGKMVWMQLESEERMQFQWASRRLWESRVQNRWVVCIVSMMEEPFG